MALLDEGRFDRVISSVHAGPVEGGASEVSALFEQHPVGDVMRIYLREVLCMIEATDVSVLAHIDYAARYWPSDARSFDVSKFELEHRRVLAALAHRNGALEINTRLPLDRQIIAWWVEEDGRRITFGSDSHAPRTVGAGFRDAAKLATSFGFPPSERRQTLGVGCISRRCRMVAERAA